MTDPLVHLSLFSIICVFYYLLWIFTDKWRKDCPWYIPFLTALFVMVISEALLWPLWYLIFH